VAVNRKWLLQFDNVFVLRRRLHGCSLDLSRATAYLLRVVSVLPQNRHISKAGAVRIAACRQREQHLRLYNPE